MQRSLQSMHQVFQCNPSSDWSRVLQTILGRCRLGRHHEDLRYLNMRIDSALAVFLKIVLVRCISRCSQVNGQAP